MGVLAFDTSNYTTSVAVLEEHKHQNLQKPLAVPQGALGLRQQEAVFQHVKALPALVAEAKAQGDFSTLTAVGVSTCPRPVEGSYMPCFLPGEQFAQTIATVLTLPLYRLSHQQGHLGASAFSLKQEALLDRNFLAWHLSGGTTELLQVTPAPLGNVNPQEIGGSSDISAGQLIDRTGQKLGLAFPAGQAVDTLAGRSLGTLAPFPLKIQDCSFSLSGMENKVSAFVAQGEAPEEICGFVLATLAFALEAVSREALSRYGQSPVLLSGGVSASLYLRQKLPDFLFPQPQFATDNAMGVALLTRRIHKETCHATAIHPLPGGEIPEIHHGQRPCADRDTDSRGNQQL